LGKMLLKVSAKNRKKLALSIPVGWRGGCGRSRTSGSPGWPPHAGANGEDCRRSRVLGLPGRPGGRRRSRRGELTGEATPLPARRARRSRRQQGVRRSGAPRSQRRVYSLWFGKWSHLGQRHGLQSTTLTSYFYKNIC
jgi:hypothetical protein